MRHQDGPGNAVSAIEAGEAGEALKRMGARRYEHATHEQNSFTISKLSAAHVASGAEPEGSKMDCTRVMGWLLSALEMRLMSLKV